MTDRNQFFGKRMTRRKAVSNAVAAGVVAGVGLAAGVGGYVLGSSSSPTRVVTETTTTTRTTTVAQQPQPPVKAGYIYVGPRGDYGWSHSHDQGRLWADRQMPTASSVILESVPEAQVTGAMQTLINQGVNLIIGTSFGYMDAMAELAEKNPNVYFVHINGFRAGVLGNAPQNMSVADVNTYQIYYLEGLAAGAVTNTGSVGIIGSFPAPVITRLVNAFALGARYAYKKRTGKEIKVNLVWLLSWFDPGKTRVAATSLIESVNADVLSYAEDSPTTLQVAEEYTTTRGKRVWSFSHYSDMTSYGRNAHLTGHIVNWGTVYLDFYRMVATKTWQSVDIWAKLGDYLPSRAALPVDQSTLGKPEGAVYMAPLHPAVPSDWVNAIKTRYEQMKESIFEPFSSEANLDEPIRDSSGQVRVKAGERATRQQIMNMDWLVDIIVSAQ
ncbi:MAG: BMP family ABC transporter substrate-binding protein [Candidatus Caldarchaeum sp.]|nr:BMP family ABC transporter substrate-binding protein [Candidatus Caldarchaeum sp.]